MHALAKLTRVTVNTYAPRERTIIMVWSGCSVIVLVVHMHHDTGNAQDCLA